MEIIEFIEKLAKVKQGWIGGTLIDSGDAFDSQLFDSTNNPVATPIIEIGPDPEYPYCFQITGETFNCSANMKYLSVVEGEPDSDKIVFNGYMGHKFQIIKAKAKQNKDG